MTESNEQIKKVLLAPFFFIGKPFMRGVLLIDAVAVIISLAITITTEITAMLTLPLLYAVQNTYFFLKTYQNEPKKPLLITIFTLYNILLSTVLLILTTVLALPLLILSIAYILIELKLQDIKHKRGVNRKPNSHYNKDGSEKINYITFNQASAAAHDYQMRLNKKMHPYKCRDGEHYHIGRAKK